MKSKDIVWTTALVTAAIVLTAVLSTASLNADTAPPTQNKAEQIARGKYLVDIMGCHDCHTPMKFGPNGPEPDMTRALSGHPEDAPMLPPANLPPGYLAAIGGTFTSFNGAWGTSFTRNLTPDK